MEDVLRSNGFVKIEMEGWLDERICGRIKQSSKCEQSSPEYDNRFEEKPRVLMQRDHKCEMDALFNMLCACKDIRLQIRITSPIPRLASIPQALLSP